jgi:hypothetical protein
MVTNRVGRKGGKDSAEIAVVLQASTEYLLTVHGSALFWRFVDCLEVLREGARVEFVDVGV